MAAYDLVSPIRTCQWLNRSRRASENKGKVQECRISELSNIDNSRKFVEQSPERAALFSRNYYI